MRVKRDTVDFSRDEHIREDITLESMAKLGPVFKPEGTVTAGNSSGMNGAGAALTAKVLDEMERADLELGLVTLCIGGGQGIALLLGRE